MKEPMKLTSLLFALLLTLITGCTTLFQPSANCIDRGDGFCWEPETVQIPVDKFTWTINDAETASTKCGFKKPFEQATCVMARNRERKSCDIVSALTIEQATKVYVNSPLKGFHWQTLFCHEVDQHCGLNLCKTNPSGIQWKHSPDNLVIPLLTRY